MSASVTSYAAARSNRSAQVMTWCYPAGHKTVTDLEATAGMRRRQVLAAGVALLPGCVGAPGNADSDPEPAPHTVESTDRLEIQFAVDEPLDVRLRVTDVDDGRVVADESYRVERWETLTLPADAESGPHRVELFLSGTRRWNETVADYESYTLVVHGPESVEVTGHSEV